MLGATEALLDLEMPYRYELRRLKLSETPSFNELVNARENLDVKYLASNLSSDGVPEFIFLHKVEDKEHEYIMGLLMRSKISIWHVADAMYKQCINGIRTGEIIFRKEVDIMATTNIAMRIDEDLKAQAEELFADLGLNMTSAITVFVKQAVREQRIPFIILRDILNAETLEAIEEVKQMKQNSSIGKSYTDVDKMMEELLG